MTLARRWLEDNAPCSLSEYYAGVVSLMPSHVNFVRKYKDPQISLAREAIRVFSRSVKHKNPVIRVDGDIITLVPQLNSKRIKYDYSWLPDIPDEGYEVSTSRCRSKKEVHALYNMLKKRGFTNKGKGVWVYHGKADAS